MLLSAQSRACFIVAGFLSVSSFGQNIKSVVFNPTDEDFANPERGWMSSEEFWNEWFYQELWPHKPNSRLIWVRWTISDFIDGRDLSTTFFESFQRMCDAAREKGFKIIPRIRYTNDRGSDAPLETVLKHIAQLKDIFARNSDIIHVIDPGMVGWWGEWNGSTNNLLDLDNRNAIIDAVLKSTPSDRMTYIRYPVYKIDYMISKGITDYVLDHTRAFNGTDIARIGHLNDCLFSTEDDAGTYHPQSSTTFMDRETGLEYMAHETPYLPHGGETCKEPDGWGINEYNACENVLKQFANLHINHLNSEYSEEIYWRWQSDGCYDSISRSLGYRFVLLEARYTQNIKPGGLMNLSFKMVNKGFGELFNPRDVYAVLQNENGETHEAVLSLDPRWWGARGHRQVLIELEIPITLPDGTYKIALWLPDKYESIKRDPRYAVRFANQDVWDESSGLNILARDVVVSKDAPGVVFNEFTTFKQHSIQNQISAVNRHGANIIAVAYHARNSALVINNIPLATKKIDVQLYDVVGKRIFSTEKHINSPVNTVEWVMPKLSPDVSVARIMCDDHAVFKKITLIGR